jgi:nicotinamide riboside kinase
MKNQPLKIILTGPESSGKTTLAMHLAQTFETNLVPEFSRPYLEFLGRPYQYSDLRTILRGQQSWEKWHSERCTKNIFVCDTDWTVIRIWEQFRFGTRLATDWVVPDPDAFYFLCAPDMPWQPDPLRENPAEREALFELYLQLLTEVKVNFTPLWGDPSQRLSNALAEIKKL